MGLTLCWSHAGSHGKKIAVIENEFGEVGIDDALVMETKEEIFEMNNGCVCCTGKSMGRSAWAIVQETKSGARMGPFDIQHCVPLVASLATSTVLSGKPPRIHLTRSHVASCPREGGKSVCSLIQKLPGQSQSSVTDYSS